MANRKAVTVSISPELLAFAERMLTCGRYGNISEVVRASLRQLEERELAFEQHRHVHEAAKQPRRSGHSASRSA